MKSDKDTPPSADELEVSIFGPGYGECIIIHYGLGKWLIVDSCVDTNKVPVAIGYFNRLGIDPAKSVTLVAATHWHDDHVRGLAKVVEACPNAQFCCSSALRTPDFINLSQIYSSAPVGMPAGPKEFNAIFRLLRSRPIGTPQAIKWSNNDQTLLRDNLLIGSKEIGVVLEALSPSDEMVTRAAIEISQHYADVRSGKLLGRLTPNHPNHVSLAMNFHIGKRSILLGSDLEETGDLLTGWAAVCSSNTRTPKKSMVYKVAHHASASGHNQDVWDHMLDKTPLSFITPFRKGRHKIPTIKDQAQILSLTENAYITADPLAARSPKKRATKIESTLKASTIERRRTIDTVGQIRWRVSLTDENDEGTVSIYDGAYQLVSKP